MVGSDKEPAEEVATAPVAAAAAEEAEDAKPSGEEEDTGAEVAPIVKLDAVAVSTGEENEDALIDLKAKLYRFDKDGNQWKERGVGQVRLLKHKETGKIRLIMRQNKTLKICANHTDAQSFKSAYEEAQKAQAAKPDIEGKDVDSAAEQLQSLKVEEKNEEKEVDSKEEKTEVSAENKE